MKKSRIIRAIPCSTCNDEELYMPRGGDILVYDNENFFCLMSTLDGRDHSADENLIDETRCLVSHRGTLRCLRFSSHECFHPTFGGLGPLEEYWGISSVNKK